MRQIAAIYEEPKEAKPCLFARHDRSEGPVLGTLFLEDLDAAKAVISYACWHPAGDDPKTPCFGRLPKKGAARDDRALWDL